MHLPDITHIKSQCLQFSIPCIQNPQTPLSTTQWITEFLPQLNHQIQEKGAVLLRGFPLYSLSEFQKIAELLSRTLLDYIYRSTPRKMIGGKIYTSTEYSSSQIIPLHNENSYSSLYPNRIFFFCSIPPNVGGQTPLTDSHLIYTKIPAEIRDLFTQKKLKYIRNFNKEIDIPWQEAFQTNDKLKVEAICKNLNIDFKWLDNEHLHTWQILPAVIQHPGTKAWVWFNQAHLFHISALAKEIQDEIIQAYSINKIPRNVCFADDSEIDFAMLDSIRNVYTQHQLLFDWQRGDLLILDNIWMAHGRAAYSGDRKIVVAMGA
ncbi:MAG: hypothetical protein LEGION0398_MBIBDBAK_00257 [Legionellaceae bacterium]